MFFPTAFHAFADDTMCTLEEFPQVRDFLRRLAERSRATHHRVRSSRRPDKNALIGIDSTLGNVTCRPKGERSLGAGLRFRKRDSLQFLRAYISGPSAAARHDHFPQDSSRRLRRRWIRSRGTTRRHRTQRIRQRFGSLAKSDLSDSATAWAQGGIAVALSDEDEIGLHEQDTIKAGDGLCRPDAVALLVEEGPKYITELIEWGTEFDRAGNQAGLHARSRP